MISPIGKKVVCFEGKKMVVGTVVGVTKALSRYNENTHRYPVDMLIVNWPTIGVYSSYEEPSIKFLDELD